MNIGWRPYLLTLLALLLLVFVGFDEAGTARKPTVCEAADSTLQHGLVSEAMTEYIALLKAHPDSDNRCATAGLDKTVKKQCVRADRIAGSDPIVAHRMLLAIAEADPLLTPTSCVWEQLALPAQPTTNPPPRLGLFALDEIATDNTFTFPIGGGEGATYSLKFIGRYGDTRASHTVTLSPAQTVTTKPHRQETVSVPVTSEAALGALSSGVGVLGIIDITGTSKKGLSSATYSLCLVRRSSGHDSGHQASPVQPVSQLFPGYASGKAPIC